MAKNDGWLKCTSCLKLVAHEAVVPLAKENEILRKELKQEIKHLKTELYVQTQIHEAVTSQFNFVNGII